MKKLIAAVIAASFTTVAFAQATPAPAKKADEKKAAPAKKDEKKAAAPAAAPATPATPATPAKK
jgi:Ni/Co efflux regulator RcnB